MLVITTACVDASHASDKETRRRLTGFIILLNRAPIILYSKIQNTVEDITFYSEFTKSKAYIEHITALRFKLRMFEIPVVESTKILFGNARVVNNSSILSYAVNKNYISIAYHFLRWHVALGVIKDSWVDTDSNLSGAMTKILTEEKRGILFVKWTY